MTVLRLKFIHRFKDRHGTVRHYFRRPGAPRVALPGLPGSAEFMAAYQAALGSVEKLPIGADRVVKGTMSSLIVAYYSSAEWKQLARVTQATIGMSWNACGQHMETSWLPIFSASMSVT
jgi:hypothetical protein